MEKFLTKCSSNSSPIFYQKETSMVEKNIVINGKFKTANLYNNTIHIILYPDDGLNAAVNLQEIEEWSEITLNLKKNT
jgi:hypothetical protein